MKVADEHDKEFQQKYSTDLDVALIFAGLFSAVSSAFIIQIQPQLNPDSPAIIVVVQGLLYTSLFTTLLAALLAVLGKQWVTHYQAAGSRGIISERGLERQRKLDGLRRWKLDMVLQIFPLLVQLALLLFSSALSLYLWPIHRAVAGIVIGLTVLGVTSYIILLASAITFSDSPFQTALASFLKTLLLPCCEIFKNTWRGKLGWTLSRYQLFRPTTWILPSFGQQSPALTDVDPPSWEVYPSIYAASKPSVEVSAVRWLLETSTDPVDLAAAAEVVVGLQWPRNLDLTTAMDRLGETLMSGFEFTVPEHGAVVGTPVKELMHRTIVCGRAYCILRHIKALMNMVTADADGIWTGLRFELPPHMEGPEGPEVSDLKCLMKILNFWPDSYQEATEAVDEWALYVIPTFTPPMPGLFPPHMVAFLSQFSKAEPRLSHRAFVDYLCCITSYFGPVDPLVLAERDKRVRKDALLFQLFKLLQTVTVHSSLVANVIYTTAQLANRLSAQDQAIKLPDFARDADSKHLMAEVSRFCSSFLGRDSLEVLVSAATLARIDDTGHRDHRTYSSGRVPLPFETGVLHTTQWIFPALQFVQRQWEEALSASGDGSQWDSAMTVAVQSLLQFLAHTAPSSLPNQPPSTSLQPIVHALSAVGDGGSDISLMAFVILCNAPHWFHNTNLQPILLEFSVWSRLGRVALRNPAYAFKYFQLGEKIASVPEWKSIMRAELSTWVMVFITPREFKFKEGLEFKSSISSIGIDLSATQRFVGSINETWILSVAALSEAWETIRLSLDLPEVIRLARCTVSTSLRVDNLRWNRSHTPKLIVPGDRAIFSTRLGKALVHAASNTINLLPQPGEGTSVGPETPVTAAVNRITELLNVLGKKLSTEFSPTSREVMLGGTTQPYSNWMELRKHLDEELDALELILGVEHLEGCVEEE
ncbi:hypothetical protein DFH06DRAFT_65401 [Mycena polygramma]|nr:hypothetical protein DFH06DRAFT_65401 [Mycena polygramma]